jgi:NAD(P)-dependent dehydrogenase (short-subunit alcohol dehydrogenase family)
MFAHENLEGTVAVLAGGTFGVGRGIASALAYLWPFAIS